ncbi:MAG: S41 family peptidase, partial [Saezia sp.]
MNQRTRIAGWMLAGAIAGIFGTIQLQAIARNSSTAMPVEQIQEFATAFGLIKTGYVETTDNAKLM